MTYHPRFISTLALAVAPLLACAQHSATVTLEGNWLLQAGNVTSSNEFVAFSYGTGQPLPGRAVFQSFQAGGIEEAPLLDGFNRYSLHTWVFDTPTKTFTFSGLDLDQVGISDELLDTTGVSLAGAYVELTFADGFYQRLRLNETAWDVSQVLSTSPVPDTPTGALALAGAVFLALRSRKNV